MGGWVDAAAFPWWGAQSINSSRYTMSRFAGTPAGVGAVADFTPPWRASALAMHTDSDVLQSTKCGSDGATVRFILARQLPLRRRGSPSLLSVGVAPRTHPCHTRPLSPLTYPGTTPDPNAATCPLASPAIRLACAGTMRAVQALGTITSVRGTCCAASTTCPNRIAWPGTGVSRPSSPGALACIWRGRSRPGPTPNLWTSTSTLRLSLDPASDPHGPRLAPGITGTLAIRGSFRRARLISGPSIAAELCCACVACPTRVVVASDVPARATKTRWRGADGAPGYP